ncbi:hypothetical protein RRF57_000136 [Xylaria bambusicola]|uniref:Uncharacterized protein n=1 Tax=Xylaria bambusicola TaxID=326684 RepID=A0AAN7U342_9PEZI
MGGGRSRNKYTYQHSDDDDDSSENDTQLTTESDTEDEDRAEMENALVQSALARIRKAKAKGKHDVKLNKGELAALQRRRKRLQAEAESSAKKKGKDRKRKKGKEDRVTVPLSQLDPAPRPHSSASRHSPPQRQGSSSPFDYQYVSPRRHASDTGMPSSSSNNLLRDEDLNAQSTDPFQYQTAGPSASYPTSALAYGELVPEDDTSNDGRVQLKSLEDVLVVEGKTPEQEYGRSKGKKSPSRNSASSGGSRRR